MNKTKHSRKDPGTGRDDPTERAGGSFASRYVTEVLRTCKTTADEYHPQNHFDSTVKQQVNNPKKKKEFEDGN